VALASVWQQSFSAGIYRGRLAPDASVYDAVNALINDEGLMYRRGGSEYESTSDAPGTLLNLFDAHLAGGQRTVYWWSGGFGQLDGASAPATISTASIPAASTPVAITDGTAVMIGTAYSGGWLIYYAGSRKTATYSTGTVSVTAGSTSVTGAGTSWAANLDPGMFLDSSSGIGVIKSVESDTALTLRVPWSGSTAAGAAYAAAPFRRDGLSAGSGPDPPAPAAIAAIGSPARLLYAEGSQVFYSPRGDLFTFTSSDYHQIPAGATAIAIGPLGTTALVYTTQGVWGISNLEFDDVDAFGNQQHVVEKVSEDLILWGPRGLATWGVAAVIPCVDDVYLFTPGSGPRPITGSIRPLYRSYVKAGYQPGTATIHRGHLWLPVLNGSTLVDVLVCRLDRPYEAPGGVFFPWTRWAGHAAGSAYAQRIGTSTRSPKLLGISGARVLDLNGALDSAAANAVEADGTTSDCVITTRDYATGGNQHGFVQRARLRYECVDGGSPDPAVALAYSSDQDAGVFTTLTEKGEQDGGTGWAVSAGDKYQWALVGKRRERIRFRVTVTGACASFVLRAIELLLRPTGKQ